jgi:cobalt/nickel transport system ATP-binding protein
LEIENVGYRYREVTALDGLSLTIGRGERIALLGANGSGKSTLLRILDGLYFPAEGRVRFDGEPLTESRLMDQEFAFAFRRRVGFVFQNPDVQLFCPTVFDELAFGPLQLRWPKDRIRERISETLETMGIGHLKDRAPHHLSGGEKKRVALASVLILDPEALLLDEPTAALDPKSASRLIDLLIEWGHGRRTVITATHDLHLVADIADRAFIFQNGRLAAEGRPDELLRDEALLRATSLTHAHRHAPGSGELHSDPHSHHHHKH